MRLLYILHVVVIVMFFGCKSDGQKGDHVHEPLESTQTTQQDTIKKSIAKETHAQIGNAHVTIKYHAPAVRGRTIWGGLVPYGDVWVTGAHNATSLEIDETILINEIKIPAGKYAFFTIPDRETWTVIINKNWDQHLADEYDQKDDVVRVKVRAEELDNSTERLRYDVVSDGNAQGKIEMSWEKVRVSVPFRVI